MHNGVKKKSDKLADVSRLFFLYQQVGDMGIVFNAFGVQFGAFVFNALLQFVHKIFFIQIVGHRLHKFDDHFPRMPQKRVFLPE